jgi:RHS repeat-associated protein
MVNGGQWTATYDTLNRLLTATQAGPPATNLAWTYDAFGNRESQTPGATMLSYPAPNNRVAGFKYDGSGNVMDDGSNQYGYDGEGRLCTVYNKTLLAYTGYAYDGLGNRVAKGTGMNSLSCDNNFTTTSNFVVGSNGEELDELNSSEALFSNVFANGQLLATYQFPSADWTYVLNDWLGTKRVVANANGARDEYCTGFPFGDNLNCPGAGDPSPQHFTGKERDTESGLDYFGARYYGSNMGRWMSPDWDSSPVAIPYADRTNPQSFNLYSYVGNNPLSRTDPDGHCTNGGQQKGFWWCLFNDSDQDAAWARQQLAQYKNISINGKIPADAAKGLNNTQTVQLNRSVFNYISSQVMSSPGMMLGLALVPGGAEELVPAEAAAAADSGSLLNLNKSLASQEQMGELAAGKGTPIAGAGTGTVLRDADRLAAQYGGNPGDWQKVASENYNPGGAKGGGFETHAYQNVKTGQVVEMKSKMQ